jgi:putative heme iron utilization protein
VTTTGPAVTTDAYTDHDVPEGTLAAPPPLGPSLPSRRRSPAEEARTIVGGGTAAALSTLTADGYPWASFVTYGLLPDGTPVLLLSTLAEHGRNLLGDQRASLMVAEESGRDPLDSGRVTLLGRAEHPTEEEHAAARDAHVAAVPMAATYADFGDFSFWVLRVERVRWVGGYGLMDSTDAASYHAAEPDPVAPSAAYAVRHLNEDHADALLAMAQALGGYTDATAASCTRADRYGLDLWVTTPRGKAPVRVPFAEPVSARDGLRAATIELARRSR